MINKLSIINEEKHFSLVMFQIYLVFIRTKTYAKYFHGTTQFFSWKWNGMSEESIENITKSGSNFPPTFVDHHSLPGIIFNWQCLIKNNLSIPEKVINLYVSYTVGPQLRNSNTDFRLSNCLFGSVNLTKNADLDK